MYPLGSFWHLQPPQDYRELFTPSDIYYIKLLKCFDCSAVLVQCHVSSMARAGLLELRLKASFSEPEVSAGTRLLSHTVGHYVGARGEPPPFSYADFWKPFPLPAQQRLLPRLFPCFRSGCASGEAVTPFEMHLRVAVPWCGRDPGHLWVFASRGRVTVPSSMGKEAEKEESPVWACREPRQASRGFGGVRPSPC